MNWTQSEFPVAPWDTAGLPQRRMDDRCLRHKHCGYRDDDPARCSVCHSSRCDGGHGVNPGDGSWKPGGAATAKHPSLREGQPLHPGEAVIATSYAYSPSEGTPTRVPAGDLNTFRVGDRVTVQRDENLFPARGTWATFRGMTAPVETVNTDTKRPHLTEYGLTLKGHGLVWFKPWELSR